MLSHVPRSALVGHGLGNRLPGIGTGFILAALTGRLFFLQSTVHEHVEFPFPCVWQVRLLQALGHFGAAALGGPGASWLVWDSMSQVQPGWLLHTGLGVSQDLLCCAAPSPGFRAALCRR